VLGLYLGGFLCPLTAVQNIFLKANTGYLLLFLVPVILALIVGRVFCGYVCPFGAIQELLHVERWTRYIPARWMKYLSKAKYILVVYLVIHVLVTREIVFLEGPFKALFSWGGLPTSIAVTVLFALFSVVVYRPFCRVLCPFGTLLSFISRFSLFRVRSGSECINYERCTVKCPTEAMNAGTVDSKECLLCGKCTAVCPIDCLDISGHRATAGPSD